MALKLLTTNTTSTNSNGSNLPKLNPNGNLPSLQSAGQIISKADMMTDFAKSTKNTGLMVRMRFPYYDDEGNVKIVNEEDWIKGFLVDGFGWSIENEYEDVLEVTQAQKNLSKMLTGGGQFASFLPSGLELTDALMQGSNKAVMSLQQTMSVWVGMKKPSFSIKVLFFDGEGTEQTNIMRVAYILERIQYPYIVDVSPIDGVNMFMQAPCGYHPQPAYGSGEDAVNKRYRVSAEGTGELHIGNYLHFPEIICTGVSFQLSDKILYNGNPQWLYVNLNFAYWRQPVLEDLKSKYGW